MRATVLSLALVAAIITLPVPASQLLNGTSSAAPASVAAAGASPALGLLLQDPFLIDQLSYTKPARFTDIAG